MVKTKFKLPKLFRLSSPIKIIAAAATFTIVLIAALLFQLRSSSVNSQRLYQKLLETQAALEQTTKSLEELKNEDQYLRNNQLEEEIENIQTTYSQAVKTYEDLIKLDEKTKDDLSEFEELYSESLSLLAERNYASASSNLIALETEIKTKENEIVAAFIIPELTPQSNTPPDAGYSRQQVATEVGNFLVSLVAADINSTRVIVDTASDSDCGNDCPVLPLATYVARNGAYAGINGSYFCPAAYPSCAGKTNTFDLLAMNKNKVYFNSDNNVYSTNPAVIFGDNYVRFVGAASQWGRDTSPNGVLSNFPLLLFNGNIAFGGDDDPKKGSKGSRSFVANQGSKVFIGVVHNATVAESARVMKALNLENAMNLDDGGSTALWFGGHKVGPGRNLPNAILFVNK